MALIAPLRSAPSDSLLAELVAQNAVMATPKGWMSDPIPVSDALMSRRHMRQDGLITKFRGPFTPQDVATVPARWRLFFYGLGAPWIYLQAYHQSGDVKYLIAAQTYILAWIAFEQHSWKPVGLLWNDNAIVERSEVLIAFWRSYRKSRIFRQGTARTILGYVVKEARMLADPKLYTLRTNHGVMQNLQLLKLQLAFPSLPPLKRLAWLAHTRLTTQLPHYINKEGVVLEHSAGYQRFGISLLGAVLRDSTLLDMPIPETWRQRYQHAKEVYAELRRPDGTLPQWGDTPATPDLTGPLITVPDEHGRFGPLHAKAHWMAPAPQMLLPRAGIAVLWRGTAQNPVQTFMSWSYFPTNGHKHPDGLGMLLWSKGQPWWTAVGYVPYSSKRREAISWDGSNAPHLVGESEHSKRHFSLLGSVISNALSALDVRRENADGFSVRRQLIQIGADLWIVIDTSADKHSRRVRTVWMADPSIRRVIRGGGDDFRLLPSVGDDALAASLVGIPVPTVSILKGSVHPFAGWVARDGTMVPTNALVVQQPSNRSVTASVFALVSRKAGLAYQQQQPTLDWQDAEHWRLAVSEPFGRFVVMRRGSMLVVTPSHGEVITGKFTTGPGVSPAVQTVTREVEADQARYGEELHAVWPYRLRMTDLLLVGLVGQSAVVWLLARWRRVRIQPLLVILSLCWIGIGAYLWLVYF